VTRKQKHRAKPVPMGFGLAQCFAFMRAPNIIPIGSKFGGDIAHNINAPTGLFLLSPINLIITPTSRDPWEQKGQKTRVTPYEGPCCFGPNWLQVVSCVLVPSQLY